MKLKSRLSDKHNMAPPAPSLLVSQPSDETEEDLENLMEDSGHGLDIGSVAAMDESRVASTSDEEEEGMEVERASRGVERRRPRRSRVAYKVHIMWIKHNIFHIFL